MLRVEALDAGYGALQVLWGVSLEVGEGEVVSLIGPNGAGKTTLIKAIVGLVRSRGGGIFFRGRRIDRLAPEEIVRQGIAVVPEGAGGFPKMTILANRKKGPVVPRARRRQAETLPPVSPRSPRPGGGPGTSPPRPPG